MGDIKKSSAEKYAEMNKLEGNFLADGIYEGTYDDLIVQLLMLTDTSRMKGYKDGIFLNGVVKGKVIADIGSGTGILSLWCAKAGAKKVYAVEMSDQAKQIKKVVEENGYSDIITVIQDDALKINLNEEIDMIVSEPLGSALICEGMFELIVNARDKFLKKGGEILPQFSTLFIAGFVDHDMYSKYDELLNNFEAIYEVKMSSFLPRLYSTMSSKAYQKMVRKEYLKTTICNFKELDFRTMTVKEANELEGDYELKIISDGTLHAFSIWYNVTFPNGVILDTGPLSPPTSWRTVVIYLEEPLLVKKGDIIQGHVFIKCYEKAKYMLEITNQYEYKGVSKKKDYFLGLDRGQLVIPPRYELDPN